MGMTDSSLRVQVVTGGHPFVAEPFFAIFDSMTEIDWTPVTTPTLGYDVVVFMTCRVCNSQAPFRQ